MFSTYLRREALCTELEDEPGELGSWKVITGAFGIRRVASMCYSRNLPLHCCFHRAGHLRHKQVFLVNGGCRNTRNKKLTTIRPETEREFQELKSPLKGPGPFTAKGEKKPWEKQILMNQMEEQSNTDFAVRRRKEKSESREEKSERSPKAKCWTYCDEGRASKLIRKACEGNTHLHLSKLHT